LPELCLRGGEAYQDDTNQRHNQGAIQNSAQYGKDPFLIFLEKTGNSLTCTNQEDQDCEEEKHPMIMEVNDASSIPPGFVAS